MPLLKRNQYQSSFGHIFLSALRLARYDRPMAINLLILPCLWAFAFIGPYPEIFQHILLFSIGSLLMRSAGCIINDWVDVDYDKQVTRTKNRPLAQNRLRKTHILIWLSLHLFAALFVLLQFNNQTILLGMALMPLVTLYPYMKRWTYWPQLFLGVTFNGGVLMVYTAKGIGLMDRGFIGEGLPLYGAAILWTLAYDTLYGMQDMQDDKKIGLKSTAILFEKNPLLPTLVPGVAMFGILLFLFVKKSFAPLGYLLLAMGFMVFLQTLRVLKTKEHHVKLSAFKAQKYVGFLILCAIVFGKFYKDIIALW